ncbi:MAG: hypothetical protein WC588_00065 [Candidatus Micrarchaeia archaeon]
MCLDSKTTKAFVNATYALLATVVVGAILYLVSSISPKEITVETLATIFVGIGVLFLANKNKDEKR